MIRHRLTTRLALSHMLVIVVGLGVAGTGLLSQSRRYFVNAERRALMVQARAVAATCDDRCIATGAVGVTVPSEQLPSAANVSQTQQNGPGNLTVNPELTSQVSAALPSNVRVFSIDGISRSAFVATALAGHEATGTESSTLVAAVPIRRRGVVVGAVEVRGTLHDVNAVLRDLQRQGVIALGIGSLAALTFGLLRARSIARPIRSLTIATRSIADGQFDLVLPEQRSHDELEQLTTAFADMRDRVRQELAVRDAFVADASHELRSPLTAIRGAVDILQTDASERPEVRARFLASLGRETDRLLRLVNNLLLMQSVEQSPACNEAVRLDELVTAVVLDLQPIAAEKQLVFTVDTPTPLSTRGDDRHLRQVLINLIANALTHAPPGSAVTIRTRSTASGCRVEVEDQGIGIPEADRDRVFDRFVRLDQSRNRDHGGAGLGLSIARTIAAAHGGTVTLHEGIAHGTIARIDLPTIGGTANLEPSP